VKLWPIQTVAIVHEIDVVAVRQQARRIAELLEFDTQDQTRIATAVSEIARNAHAYGARGRVEFILEGARRPERLLVRVSDTGPGFDDVEALLAGRFTPKGEGLGLGIAGARRLMDAFEIASRPGDGAVVAMRKRLPADAPRTRS
jgi:anti-sigma regulatory factor (Ser/Thr protein kinase)